MPTAKAGDLRRSSAVATSDGFHPEAAEKVAGELVEFVRRAPNTVVVSDFICSDAAGYDEWTLCYRRGLAQIDRALARACDCVCEAVAGQIIVYKGAIP